MQTSYFNVSNLSILNLLRGEKFPMQGGKFNLSTQATPEPGKCFCVQVTNFPVNKKGKMSKSWKNKRNLVNKVFET